MIPIKIECGCGQKYAFDVEPVDGRMGTTVACPNCGTDGTAIANQMIAQALAAQAQRPQPYNPAPSATVVVPAVAVNPAPGASVAPIAKPATVAPVAAAIPAPRVPQASAVPVRPSVAPAQSPGVAPSTPAPAAASTPVSAAPKGPLTKKQLIQIIVITASVIIGAGVAQYLYKKGYFGMSEELKKKLTVAQAQVNSMATKFRNPLVRIEAAAVGPGKKFTCNYTLLTQKKSEMDVGKWRQTTEGTLKKAARNDREILSLLKEGVTVCYRYKGKDGELIGEIEIEPSDVLGK